MRENSFLTSMNLSCSVTEAISLLLGTPVVEEGPDLNRPVTVRTLTRDLKYPKQPTSTRAEEIRLSICTKFSCEPKWEDEFYEALNGVPRRCLYKVSWSKALRLKFASSGTPGFREPISPEDQRASVINIEYFIEE